MNKSEQKIIKVLPEEFREMLCYAIRYAYLRHSYARWSAKEWLEKYLDLITLHEIDLLIDDCKRALSMSDMTLSKSIFIEDYEDMLSHLLKMKEKKESLK